MTSQGMPNTGISQIVALSTLKSPIPTPSCSPSPHPPLTIIFCSKSQPLFAFMWTDQTSTNHRNSPRHFFPKVSMMASLFPAILHQRPPFPPPYFFHLLQYFNDLPSSVKTPLLQSLCSFLPSRYPLTPTTPPIGLTSLGSLLSPKVPLPGLTSPSLP